MTEEQFAMALLNYYNYFNKHGITSIEPLDQLKGIREESLADFRSIMSDNYDENPEDAIDPKTLTDEDIEQEYLESFLYHFMANIEFLDILSKQKLVESVFDYGDM